MYELSLFTGVGGGLLGTMLLGWRCVGAVEFADYPVKVLEARQNDGHLEQFPIWHMDIREFNRRIAPMYSGVVDVVSAGFPCQPFSVAGQQRGADDPRNMWPATIECIRLVRPRFCFLENVSGLVNSGYFGTILGDLAESGYDARWRILSAAEMGAPHKRDRLWILGYSQHDGLPAVEKLRGDEKTGDQWGKKKQKETRESEGANRPPDVPGVYRSEDGSKQDVADAAGSQSRQQTQWQGWENSRGRSVDSRGGADTGRKAVADAAGTRNSRPEDGQSPGQRQPESGNGSVQDDMGNANHPGRPQQRFAIANGEEYEATECGGWWEAEPDVGRVVDGVAARVDRLKALGNGQVPAVVAEAWRLLTTET